MILFIQPDGNFGVDIFFTATAAQKAAYYVNLGYSYYKQGQYQEAVEQFEKGPVPGRKLSDINALLGSAFFQKGETEKAIAAYKRTNRDHTQDCGSPLQPWARLSKTNIL